MNTYTARQVHLIASTLDALATLPEYADGQYLRVNLMDENYSDPVGSFTHEEGVWLFEADAPSAPAPATLEEVARSVYNSNPTHYRDRKINHIKDTRSAWATITGRPCGLLEAKNAVEEIQQEQALWDLRAKLIGDPEAPYYDEDAEWRAQARAREQQAEQGTWFGAPGPMDEEPF